MYRKAFMILVGMALSFTAYAQEEQSEGKYSRATFALPAFYHPNPQLELEIPGVVNVEGEIDYNSKFFQNGEAAYGHRWLVTDGLVDAVSFEGGVKWNRFHVGEVNPHTVEFAALPAAEAHHYAQAYGMEPKVNVDDHFRATYGDFLDNLGVTVGAVLEKARSHRVEDANDGVDGFYIATIAGLSRSTLGDHSDWTNVLQVGAGYYLGIGDSVITRYGVQATRYGGANYGHTQVDPYARYQFTFTLLNLYGN